MRLNTLKKFKIVFGFFVFIFFAIFSLEISAVFAQTPPDPSAPLQNVAPETQNEVIPKVEEPAPKSAPKSAFIPDCALKETAEEVEADYCKDVNSLLQLAINIGNFIFSIIGVVALVMFVYGGFMMIISMGKAENVTKGKDAMVAAIVGMLIAFGGYLLIRFVMDALGVGAEFRAN